MAKDNKEKEIIKEEIKKEIKEETEEKTSETAEETKETEASKAPGTSEEETNQEAPEEAAEEKEAVTEDDLKDEESKDSGEGKKKLFGKGKDKEKDKLKEQVAELNDKVVRQMAEFDNFRKRTEKEKQQMFETGAKSVIEKILPVVDNFERGIAALSEEEKEGQFAQGVIMVYKQLMDELEKMEVKPIEAVGQEFNPELHNAVMHIEDENLGENIIAAELQKGYTYRDQVVRHSMVQVAN